MHASGQVDQMAKDKAMTSETTQNDGLPPDSDELMLAINPTEDELKLSELLILATLWMLFGFMLWFYLSAFHGAPVRIASDMLLNHVLGSNFHQVIVNPDQHFLLQVETTIPFTFRDGTTEALGFIVNPLVYSYGLPLLFGLVMGSDVSWVRKGVIMLVGYVTITGVQIWGVFWQSLKMLAFNFGSQTYQIVQGTGISDSAIALGYQLGSLILPALAPIFVWVLSNRKLVEQFVGWRVGEIMKKRNR
jgi:hypothetical protein